jgi:hypothetical protein
MERTTRRMTLGLSFDGDRQPAHQRTLPATLFDLRSSNEQTAKALVPEQTGFSSPSRLSCLDRISPHRQTRGFQPGPVVDALAASRARTRD